MKKNWYFEVYVKGSGFFGPAWVRQPGNYGSLIDVVKAASAYGARPYRVKSETVQSRSMEATT